MRTCSLVSMVAGHKRMLLLVSVMSHALKQVYVTAQLLGAFLAALLTMPLYGFGPECGVGGGQGAAADAEVCSLLGMGGQGASSVCRGLLSSATDPGCELYMNHLQGLCSTQRSVRYHHSKSIFCSCTYPNAHGANYLRMKRQLVHEPA